MFRCCSFTLFPELCGKAEENTIINSSEVRPTDGGNTISRVCVILEQLWSLCNPFTSSQSVSKPVFWSASVPLLARPNSGECVCVYVCVRVSG